MYYVYVLLCQKKKIYVGVTSDLKRRVNEHYRGNTYSTKRLGVEKLIYYESFINKKDAYAQEAFYKTGYGREVLKGKLANTLKDIR